MEENQPVQQDLLDVEVTEELRSNFGSAAIWAKLAAVISIISATVNVVANIIVSNWSGLVGAMIGAGISLLCAVFLLRFANSIIKGVGDDDQSFFNDGLYHLSVYFKVLGVLMIVAIILVILLFILGISLFRNFRI